MKKIFATKNFLLSFLLKKPALLSFYFGAIGVCKCEFLACRYIYIYNTNIFLGLRKATCPQYTAWAKRHGLLKNRLPL